MSSRAYKVIKIETERGESFNISHNFDLLSNFLGAFIDRLNEDCCGLSSIDRDDVETAIEDIDRIIQKKWEGHENAEKWSDMKTVLEDILDDMGEDTEVEYLCY